MIEEIVEESLKIEINKINLDYIINDPIHIKLPLPKLDEKIEVDKEVFIEEINRNIGVNYITRLYKEDYEIIEVLFKDKKIEEDKTSLIFMNVTGRSGYSERFENSDGNEIIKGIDIEDLRFKERILNNLDLQLNKFTLEEEGNWNFILE